MAEMAETLELIGFAAEFVAGVHAVDGAGGSHADFAAMDVDSIKQRDDGGGVGGVDVFLEDFPGDGAVHGAGIDHDQAEAFGDLAGERAFSRGGGAVDGDGEALWMGGVVRTHAWEGGMMDGEQAGMPVSRFGNGWE